MHQHRLSLSVPLIMQSQNSNVLLSLNYWTGCLTEVTWLAREYACVCCIIEERRNAGVGLVKQLDHEKGLSVCWSTRVQRLHIVSLASIGLLYCSSFSHLPRTATHQRGGRKCLFIDGSVGACRVSQLATTAFPDPEPFPSNKQPAWMLQSDSLPPAPPWSSGEAAKHQSKSSNEWQVFC